LLLEKKKKKSGSQGISPPASFFNVKRYF